MLTNKNWNCSMSQVLDVVDGKTGWNIIKCYFKSTYS